MDEKIQEVVDVRAGYKLIATFKNVEIKLPGINDEMKYVIEHSFRDRSGEIREVNTHFKKVDYYNRIPVTRNFYIYPGLRGREIRKITVHLVKVFEKDDDFRHGLKTFVLDIILDDFGDEKLIAESRLTIGCPSGEFDIAGAPGKFIDFKKIKTKEKAQ